MKKNTIVGLDIGTTKICAIVAEVYPEGPPKIIGIGHSVSEGLHQGVVVNLEATIKSITSAVNEAQNMAAVAVTDVYVGIAGEHIKSTNSPGVIGISNPDLEIKKKDIERVIEAARNSVKLPNDRQIIHSIPQTFVVDEQTGIKDPTGMYGSRLEADVHFVTGAITYVKNLGRSVERAGLNVKGFVLEPLASSNSILTDDEKKLGVVILDIGGGTSDIAIFTEGSIRFTKAVALAGEIVTQDISKVLGISYDQAELAKRKFGVADKRLITEDELIEIPGLNNRPTKTISRYELAMIIESRMRELFEFALESMKTSSYFDYLPAGLVLTGGGSLLSGIENIAKEIFNLDVVIGKPQKFTGLSDVAKSPIYATGVGLVLYGNSFEQINQSFKNFDVSKTQETVNTSKTNTSAKNQNLNSVQNKEPQKTETKKDDPIDKMKIEDFKTRMVKWFQEFF
ncbi:MAG: cell division protein FtsA [Calditrichaeota bacterium]|nr:MAG: cell division protein FtsA [Calditrichota bacterium]